MKKTTKLFALGALTLGVAAGCASEQNSALAAGFDTTDGVYAYSALSATNVLSTFASNQALINNEMGGRGAPSLERGGIGGFVDRMLQRNEVTLSEEELAEVTQYVGVFESLLSEEQAPIQSSTITSEDPNYAFQMTITTKTIDLEDVVYTMYFNEVVTDTQEDLPIEQREDMIATDLEGILIVGDYLYQVEGKKVINDNHSLVTFTSKVDDDNYVRISEHVVDNKKQFHYTVVANGEVVSQSKIRFASQNNRETIFLDTTVDGENKSYRFTKFVKDEETWIHMMIGSGITSKNVFIRVTIDEETQEEIYAFYAGNNAFGSAKRMLKEKFAHRRGE